MNEVDNQRPAGNKRSMSLTLRIWLFFALVNGMTVIATLGTTWYLSRLAVEERATEQVQQQVADIRQNFQVKVVDQLQYHLELLAGLPTVDEMLRSSEQEQILLIDRLYRQFGLITGNIKGYDAVSYVLMDGEVGLHLEKGRRVRNMESLGRPDAGGDDEMVQAMSALYRELRKRPLLLSAGNMEWFMPPRSMVASRVVRSADGHPSIIVAFAKLDVDIGDFGGAIMIRYNLDGFLESLAGVRILGAGGVWLVDEAGQVLTRPSGADDTALPPGLDAANPEPAGGVVALANGLTGYGELAMTRYSTPMRFALTVPSAAFATGFDPLFLVFAATVVAAALIFGIFAIAASRRLTRPITALRDAAQNIAEGKFDIRINHESPGEIGELEDSFNRMTQNLQSAIRSRDNSLEQLQLQSVKQEKLIRERIEAEAAAKASSELLAHMSHELRTPLNSIIGFTDVMGKKLFGPLGHAKYEEYVSDVTYSANHLLGLISDILDLSKIEAGQMEPDVAPIHVGELIAECAVIARPAARSDLARLDTAIADPLPALMGDSRMLRQVLINLLSNAMKFTPANGMVEIGAARTTDGGLRIWVHDTGVGIPADKIQHVLQPFGQVRNSSSHAHSGTGLGLSLSLRLVELNGGQFKMESAPGAGTRVTIAYPADRTQDIDDDVLELAAFAVPRTGTA